MSRFGKSLWSEDARQPFPLELAQWSRVGRPGGAVGLNAQELLVYHESGLRVGPRRRTRQEYMQRGFEHRVWPHTVSRGVPQSLVLRCCLAGNRS